MKISPLLLCSVIALPLAASSLTGCMVAADPAPVAYAEVSSAPPDIEIYPSVVYEGRPTYYYQDRWYYRDGGHWRYYRQEPVFLSRQRTYVQSAPPARRGYVAAPQVAPPAPRVYAAPPAAAPPAYGPRPAPHLNAAPRPQPHGRVEAPPARRE